MPARLATFCLIAALASANAVLAQSVEEYELKNGRRIPVASVKPAGTGFTATLTVGTTAQVVNFSAKDIVRATLREPDALNQARLMIANGKPEDVAIQMEKLAAELAPLQAVPGAWWHRAVILHMDALACRNKPDEAAALVDPTVLDQLPPENAALLTDFRTIVAKPPTSPDLKINSLQALAKRSTDSWVTARAWLEIGNILSNQGKTEEAVKAFLRVPVFHAAENDLAVRGLISAARGLQQLERAEDGVKLLTDYLDDHVGTPFAKTIDTELVKLDPSRKKSLRAPGEETPAADNTKDKDAKEEKDEKEATDKPATEPEKPASEPAKPAAEPPKDSKPAAPADEKTTPAKEPKPE